MLSDALNSIKSAMADAMPGRVITRNLLNFDLRGYEDLRAGILTIVTNDESGYANYRGREADLGKLKLLFVAQLVLPEGVEPSEVEDAEFVFAEEVKEFLKGAIPVDDVLLKSIKFSSQEQVPYGWFAMNVEVMP